MDLTSNVGHHQNFVNGLAFFYVIMCVHQWLGQLPMYMYLHVSRCGTVCTCILVEEKGRGASMVCGLDGINSTLPHKALYGCVFALGCKCNIALNVLSFCSRELYTVSASVLMELAKPFMGAPTMTHQSWHSHPIHGIPSRIGGVYIK